MSDSTGEEREGREEGEKERKGNTLNTLEHSKN